MIKSVWKPYYLKSKPVYYELVDLEILKEKKGNSALKVIWSCDNPNCKTPNKLHSISACHLVKDKMSKDIQICRPCQCTGEGNGRYGDKRKWDDFFDEDKLNELKKFYSQKWKGELNPSKKEEVKIKKNQNIINEEFLNKIVSEKKFKLISISEINGKNSKFTVECENGHISNKTYVNFNKKGKKFICEKCFYESIQIYLTNEEILEYENFKKKVRMITAKNYKKYKEVINPKNLKIGRGYYHIDHKYSIYEGFKNKILPEILAAKENLEIISEYENCSKQSKCSIKINELLKKTDYLYKK